MQKRFDIKCVEETILLGERIGKLLHAKDVVLLVGNLSAGKTTLTKGIGLGLGINKIINSPTFTIVKEYKGRCPLYDLDLYRLNGLNTDFDLEEFIEGDGVCVIEWPYQVEELLPKEFLYIELERVDDTHRVIQLEAKGARYEEVLNQL